MRRLVPRNAMAAPMMLLAALSLGCVTPGSQFSATAGYGVGYYGPVGVWGPRYYGVWGPRYRVAPYRAPVRSRAFLSGRKAPHAFRAAPVGRPVPSIPRRRARARRWSALAPPRGELLVAGTVLIRFVTEPGLLEVAAYRFGDRNCAREPVLTVDAPAMCARGARREPESKTRGAPLTQ